MARSNPRGRLQSSAAPEDKTEQRRHQKWTSDEAAVNSELSSIPQGTLWNLVRSLEATLNLHIYLCENLDCEQAYTALALICVISEDDLGFYIFH